MPARLKLFLPLIIFAVLAVFLVRGLQLDPRALPSALIGKPLPAFYLPVLGSEQTLDRAAVTGRVALFNVWATWCPTCRAEHAYLDQLSSEGVLIYGVDYKDEDAAAQQWLDELGNPYAAVIIDREGSLALDLGVYGAPETFLVDAGGVVRYRQVGAIDEQVWHDTLGPLYESLKKEQRQ